MSRRVAERVSSGRARIVACGAAMVGVLVLAGAPPLRSQAASRPPTFGTGVEIVNLNLSVTDPRNEFVTDLQEGDFAVYEDGIPQELTLFTHENLPISLVLMMDASASMEERRKTAQEAAARLARTLRPQDEAQVVEFNDRARVLQPFTHDEAAVEAAIRRTDAAGPTALHNALYVSIKELQRGARTGELRRRAIVMFTDGEDTASLVTDDQVLDAAKKSEVTIYTIVLRSERPQDRMREAFSEAEYLMNTLARETGGHAYFPTSLSELDSVYDRIAEELRTLYSVGYASNNPRRDGKWRRIVVRVRTREGLTVRHRLGYYAPTG
jgi:Ca-activated chloride channel family protein